METAGGIVFSGIAPHPPIMVPEIGKTAIVEVRSSIAAMEEFTRRVLASGAQTVVLISPHAPLEPAAFVAYSGPKLFADFSNFRAPETTVEAELDKELLDAITLQANSLNYEIVELRNWELDHGTAVPLYFLQRHGWHGSVVAFGYSFLGVDDHLRFGACIGEAAAKIGRRVAFVASGDLSHRLKPEAPAGYNPNAHLFDEDVVAAVSANEPDRITRIDSTLRKLAGECGYRSMLVAVGATPAASLQCEVLNYEAPFGVGYLVAQLSNANTATISDAAPESTDDLPQLARTAVETFVKEGIRFEATPPQGLLAARAACFVSIKTIDGDLRGCIGTIEPQQDTLQQEIITNAISAATHDPRFYPIAVEELPVLKYSVDVLAPPEPAVFADLNPDVYGVIVESEDGERRGLLLPDIPGVGNATAQVEIAKRKAGIQPHEPVKLLRFRVDRYREQLGPSD